MGVTGYAIKPIGLNSSVIKKIEEIIKLNHISGKVYTSVMSVDYNIARVYIYIYYLFLFFFSFSSFSNGFILLFCLESFRR